MKQDCPLSNGGSAPATLGFNAVAPEWSFYGRLAPPRPFWPLSRRSGRIPALPSSAQVLPEWINRNLAAIASQPTAITPLTSCLPFGVHSRVAVPRDRSLDNL